MNIIVFLKMVPDVVEELKIADNGITLDEDWLRLKLNDSEEQALEEAILLKEKFGGTVTAVALDTPEIDESLFLALAKGADKAVKIIGDWKDYRSPAIAKVFAEYIYKNEILNSNDTIFLAGAQSFDDIEGEMTYYLSRNLELPVEGVVTAINYEPAQNSITFIKEFAGGLRGEFITPLPAIIGIQAAENPPRYIPIAKIRAIMKTAKIEEVEIVLEEVPDFLAINKMFEPETSDKAEMLEGNPDAIASRIVDILTEKAII
ncbi:MAG: hypothetical protein ABSG15_01835 [FCB group bacterium]|jgi:electron transfer flavoprotein beta subunit